MIILYVLAAVLTYIGAAELLKWAIRKDVDRQLEKEWGSSYTKYRNRK